MAARKFQFNINHGQAAAVGRYQRKLVFFKAEQNTVEHVTGLIGRNGIGRFAQTLPQIFLPHGNDFCVLEFG